MFSGVTDCYQAIEAELELTRSASRCASSTGTRSSVISKSALVERDIDAARRARARGAVATSASASRSPTTRSRARSSRGRRRRTRRFKVIETLAKAGVPVGVMCAPVIPGLNDEPARRACSRRAARAGAHAGPAGCCSACPAPVKQVFEDRVRAAHAARRRQDPASHPRDARRRQALRRAVRHARPRRGRLRRDDRPAVRRDGAPPRPERARRGIRDAVALPPAAARPAELF